MIDIQQDPERVPGRMIVRALAVVIVSILISAGLVYVVAWRLDLTGGGGSEPGVAIPAHINSLDSSFFGELQQAEVQARAARRRLTSWGWVDPARRRIHVPLDVATELYLGEAPR